MNTLNEKGAARGMITFRRRDRHGKVTGVWTIKNLIVTVGKALQAGLLTGDVSDYIGYIAIGTGVVAAAAGNTTLGTEVDRQAVVASLVTTTTTDDTAQFVATFAFAGAAAITEAGLFNDPTAGALLSRQVFAAINVVNLDSLEVTWKIQY